MIDVTIVVASFNKGKFILETIDSVLNQYHSNWELLIVDDCSTDETVTIIEHELKDSRIRLIKSKMNKGANYCRNIGLKEAKGKYLMFLDADDLLAKNCLQNRISQAMKVPDSNLLVFTMGVFYNKPGDDKRLWNPVSRQPLKDFLQHKLPWSILQPLWKREFLLDLGGFDETFLRLQDVELNTKALLHKNVKYKLFSAEPDCYYRIDEGRKNFDAFNFLKRWTNSSLQYCEKFKDLVQKKERSFLLGTIYQTQLQIIFQYKNKVISKNEFDYLYSQINSSTLMREIGVLKKFILAFAKSYNLHFIRIPGLNKLVASTLII